MLEANMHFSKLGCIELTIKKLREAEWKEVRPYKWTADLLEASMLCRMSVRAT